MRRILGIMLLLIDIAMLPMLIARYIVLSVDLLFACAMTKGQFKKEFADYNDIVRIKLRARLYQHKGLILG